MGDTEPDEVGTETTTTVTRTPILSPEAEAADFDSVYGGLFADLGGDGPHKVYIYRKGLPGQEPWVFLGHLHVDEFSEEVVAELYGGGRYRIQARDKDGAIQRATSRFEIAGVPKDPKWDRDDDSGGIEAGVLAGGVSTTTLLLALLKDARNPPPAAATANPVDMAVSLMTAMQTATAPLLAAILKSKENPGGGAGAADVLKLVKEGIALGREAGGGGGDGYADVIRSVVPMIGNLAKQHGEAEPAALPPGPVAPADPGTVPGWVTALSPYVQMVQPHAEAGRDPELYARLAADQMSEAASRFVVEQFDRGDIFQSEFFAYFPQCVPVRLWWDEFFPVLESLLVVVEDAVLAEPVGRSEIIPSPVGYPVPYSPGRPAPLPPSHVREVG